MHRNKLSRKNNLERGSALIAAMVFAIVASIAVLSIQGLIENNQSLASKSALDNEFLELLNDIKNTIGNENFCNTTNTGLLGLKISGTKLDTLKAPTSLRVSIPGSNKTTIGNGWKNSSGSLRFHSFELELVGLEGSANSPSLEDRYFRATSNTRSRKALYRLIANFKKCSTLACNDNNVQFFTNKRNSSGHLNSNAIDIPIYVHLSANSSYRVNSNAAVVSCFSEGSGADYCEKLGSVWNPSASAAKFKCEPRLSCRYRKALSNGKCSNSDSQVDSRYKPILTGISDALPSGFNNSQTPNITSCGWCNSNL